MTPCIRGLIACLESQAAADLDRSRACAFLGLQAADGAERGGSLRKTGIAVVRMVEEVRHRGSQTKSGPFFIPEAAVQRKRDGLHSWTLHCSDLRIAKAADVIRRNGKRCRINPLFDRLVFGTHGDARYDV